MHLLETRQLGKSYRLRGGNAVEVLRDVTLAIPAGSFTAITGASGAGKTTLRSLLGALERPSRGEILFEDQPLSGWSDAALARLRRRLGFVFQDFALLPGLSLIDNITYPLSPRGDAPSVRSLRTPSGAECAPLRAGPPCAAAPLPTISEAV